MASAGLPIGTKGARLYATTFSTHQQASANGAHGQISILTRRFSQTWASTSRHMVGLTHPYESVAGQLTWFS